MNVIVFYLFFHWFHILLFFDVKCFSFLKVAYKEKIEKTIRMHFLYITKKDFFFVFKQVFLILMDEDNIRTKS